MTDEKPLSERTPTMDELKEKVDLLECKITYNCPYPDRVKALEAERNTLKEQLGDNKWMAEMVISKRLQVAESRLLKAQELPMPIWTEDRFKSKPTGIFGIIFWDKDKYFKTLEEWHNELKKALGGDS